jgi:hypothetical protein
MPTRAEVDYGRRCEVARRWAATTDFEQQRKGNAARVARSYNIKHEDALSIIVNAYRGRKEDG